MIYTEFMADLWTDLVDCLRLRPLPDTDAGEALFEGTNQHLEYHRVFGGQLLAQFLRAAAERFPDRAVKSMHATFAREGRADTPMRYRLRTHHAGRSFATVTILAEQGDTVVATASLSLHTPEDGPARQTVEPIEALPGTEFTRDWSLLPWEIRATDDLDDTGTAPAEFAFWMRTPEIAADFAPAVAAYATDLTLIGTALRPVDGYAQSGNGTAFLSAVTSHTLWFHREFRVDDWLLLRQHSPVLAHGRCFGRGDILTAAGTLVASYAQEALLRLPVPAAG